MERTSLVSPLMGHMTGWVMCGGFPWFGGGGVGGEAKLVKIADFKKNCFIFKDHVRGGYVCFANM